MTRTESRAGERESSSASKSSSPCRANATTSSARSAARAISMDTPPERDDVRETMIDER
jgi:hypothetical protein